MRQLITKAEAQTICKSEGINFADILKEPQLLKSGAKLRFSKPHYCISGYAQSGGDVEKTLKLIR